ASLSAQRHHRPLTSSLVLQAPASNSMRHLVALLSVLALLIAQPAYAFSSNSFDTQIVSASTQYWTAADTASLSVTGDFSLSVWVKINNQPATNGQYLMYGKSDYGVDVDRAYTFRVQDLSGTKQIRLGISGTGSSNTDDIWTLTLTTGTWYNLLVVYTTA